MSFDVRERSLRLAAWRRAGALAELDAAVIREAVGEHPVLIVCDEASCAAMADHLARFLRCETLPVRWRGGLLAFDPNSPANLVGPVWIERVAHLRTLETEGATGILADAAATCWLTRTWRQSLSAFGAACVVAAERLTRSLPTLPVVPLLTLLDHCDRPRTFRGRTERLRPLIPADLLG